MMTELLSPAGDFEKLRAAIRYGADAVYLAGEAFGMRAASANFTNEELGDYIRRHTPEEACEKLVREACERGGRDNITAIIIDARS